MSPIKYQTPKITDLIFWASILDIISIQCYLRPTVKFIFAFLVLSALTVTNSFAHFDAQTEFDEFNCDRLLVGDGTSGQQPAVRTALDLLQKKARTLEVEIFEKKHIHIRVDYWLLKFLVDSSPLALGDPSQLFGELDHLMNTYADEILKVATDGGLHRPYFLVLKIDQIHTYAFVEVYHFGRPIKLRREFVPEL